MPTTEFKYSPLAFRANVMVAFFAPRLFLYKLSHHRDIQTTSKTRIVHDTKEFHGNTMPVAKTTSPSWCYIAQWFFCLPP